MVAGGFNPRYECNRLLRVAQRRDECNAALPALKGRATSVAALRLRGYLFFLSLFLFLSFSLSIFASPIGILT